jgi:hypothetical protein
MNFRTVLPSERDGCFLRACLHEHDAADDGWRRWLREATADGTPARRALAAVNSLLPLLAWNLRRTHVEVDRPLQTHFRSALLTEELRWQRYRAICELAFALLSDARIPFIALKGAVVGERYYPLAMLRHADDVDVLVHEPDIERATTVFLRAGWRQGAPPVFRQPLHAPALMHEADVSIELHRRLVIPHFTVPYGRLWARTERVRLGAADVGVLATSDALLHTLAHAMQSTRDLRWVADAWFMLSKDAIDWRMFTETAIVSRLALPIHAALTYLAREVDAAVPATVLDELTQAARRASYADREAARPWPIGRVFPPPVQFALHYDVPVWSVPYYYFYRLARHVGLRRAASGDVRVRALGSPQSTRA